MTMTMKFIHGLKWIQKNLADNMVLYKITYIIHNYSLFVL